MVMTENPTLRRVNVIFCMCQNATGVVPLVTVHLLWEALSVVYMR